MLATEQSVDTTPSDELWKAFRPSPPASEPLVVAEASEEFRHSMLQSQDFRRIMPSANTHPATNGHSKEVDRATIDTVFACLAICADEERRAISFGSQDGATAMRRSMLAIKKKFGIS